MNNMSLPLEWLITKRNSIKHNLFKNVYKESASCENFAKLTLGIKIDWKCISEGVNE